MATPKTRIALLLAVALTTASLGPSRPDVLAQAGQVLYGNAQSCPLSHGYWKTHPLDWPASSLILGNPSNPRHTYWHHELLNLLNLPSHGDASIILSTQLIAAKLNIARGSNPAPIAAWVARADALLGAFSGRLPYRIGSRTPVGTDMTTTAKWLEDYNLGRLPGGCGRANQAPIAGAGPDQTLAVGTIAQLDGSASSDPDGDVLTYSWAFVSTPAGSQAALSDASLVAPTFAIDLPGAYELRLVVSDGSASSLPDTVVISTINSPPVAHAGEDTTARVGETVTLDGSRSTDVDGDQLHYAWSFVSRPGGSLATLTDPAAVNPAFTLDRAGDYVVQLVVDDGTAQSAEDPVLVSTVNSRPVAHAGSDQTIFVGTPVQLDGSGSVDVDGHALTYQWSLIGRPNGSAAALSDAALVRPTFVPDLSGTYVAQLIVTDGSLESEPDTVTLTSGNRAPIAAAGRDQTVSVGATVELDGSASSDPDGDPLGFAWSLLSVPSGSTAALVGNTSATPSFVADMPGTYVAQLIVNDGVLGSTPGTVTISTENSRPTANAGPDQTVESGNTVQLDGSGSFDPDGSPLQFSWSLLSRPAGSAAELSDPLAEAPRFVADADGVYVVQLIVGDGTLLSLADTMTVTAAGGADLAIAFLNPPAGTFPPGAAVSFAVSVTNLGPLDTTGVSAGVAFPAGYTGTTYVASEGTYDAATGVWTIGALNASAVARLDVQAVVNASGPLALSAGIIAAAHDDPDPSNNTAAAAPANRPPVADAGADRPVTAGATAVLDGSASADADGDSLSFQWTLTTRPPGSSAALAGGASPTPTFVADRSGQFVAELVVSDGRGGSASDTVSIAAAVNRPPVITSTPPTAGAAGTAYAYAVNASDPDPGDALTFSLPIAPAGMAIDGATGVIRWTPGGNQTGNNNVAVHVRDRAGLLAAQGFHIAVATGAGNGPPSAHDDEYDARTGDSLSVPAPGILGNDNDPEGNRLRARALTQPANGTAIVNADGSFTYTPFTFQEGELVLAENINLATHLAGTTVQVSSDDTANLPARAIDGSPGTSWLTAAADNANTGPLSRTGGLPFIELSFPQAVEVTRLQALGHRDPVLARCITGFFDCPYILAGEFQLFDESGAELYNSGPVDMSLAPHDAAVTVPDLFQRSRNVAREPGVVHRASSALDASHAAAAAFDGNLKTEWASAFFVPLPQFLEVEFPRDTAVHRVRIFGNRSGTTSDFLAFVVQVFDAAGDLLFDSGTISVTAASSDATVDVGGVTGGRRVRVSGTVLQSQGGFGGIAELEVISTETVATRLNGTVRRARFTDTLDNSFVVGLSEFRVIGSTLVRRERQVEPNLTQLLPARVRASSFIPDLNAPENAIDDTLARNWYAASSAPGEFLEIEFPAPTTVTGLVVTNPTARPDGFGTSLTINCTGSFTLIAADGSVLFDSGPVNQPSGALSAQFPFTLPVGSIAGVTRVRYTSAGCHSSSSFSPGFSEVRVLGSTEVTAPALDMRLKFQALLGREVHSTPLVANLTDDNGDGRIDTADVPDIIAIAEAVDDQLAGEIKVISGDDGREMITMGAPNQVSPWSEPAVGDLDGDGRPEIVAVRRQGGAASTHLIAFDVAGAVKWLSDANPMPQASIGGTTVDVGAVAIANLDASGGPEVIVGASVFSAAGQLLGDGRALGGTTGGNGLRSRMSAVADIDLDGTPELVAGPTAYRLVSGALGIAWQRSDRPDGYVGIANADDDPLAEIVVVANGVVYMLNHDGSDAPVWNAPSHAPVPIPGGGQGGAPTIADLDGDGVPEIGVAGSGYYTVFNRDGSIRWNAVISDRTSNATGSTVFDLDGDGSVEVIYRDEVNLRIYRGTDGVLLAKRPLGSSTWSEMPVVADVDNDGHADIVVGSDQFILNGLAHTGVHVLQDVANRWVRTRRIWNQHAYHVTNVNEDAAIPAIEAPHFVRADLNGFRLNTLVADGDEDSADRFSYVASDGGLDSTPATVHIAVRTPNSAPRITSAGVADAAIGVLYLYAPQAVDPDAGDILTFSLPTAPAGMSIDAASGLIRWTPTDAQRGSHEVVVKVQDLRGLYALQGYAVEVGNAIAVPDVVGAARGAAEAALATALLRVGAVGTRHSPTVPADAVITQSPAAGTLVARQALVDLVVSLGPAPAGTVPDVVGQQQSRAQQDIAAAGFAVGTVAGAFNAAAAPGIVLAQNPAGGAQAPAGSPISITVSLGVPPGERDEDGDGFTGDEGDCNDTNPAVHPGAPDVAGDGIDQNCNGADSIPGDEVPPTAAIESPADLAVVTMPIDILGTATDAHFLRYTVTLAEADATTAVTIGSGSAAVTNAALGRLDPTLLENGLYRVRLVVEDVNGHTSVDERVYRVDGLAKIGNFRLSFVDLSVPVIGVPITIVRTYDSRVKSRGDFGVGWTLDVRRGSYRHNRTPGRGWIIRDQPFLGDFLPCIGGSLETLSHLTEVRLSDRESYTFALEVTNGNLGITGACEGVARFRFVDGTRPGATLDILDGTAVIYLRGGDDTVLDMNAFLDGSSRPYNPQRVRLTTLDGTAIDLDRHSGITRIADLNGNVQSIAANGIVHSSGRSISFDRDTENRITRITDPLGNHLEYSYDDDGNLAQFRDAAGNRTTFSYDDDHNLVEIIDPLGNRAGRAEYDSTGRLVAMIDASGRRLAMDHDISARRETLTDRLGGITLIEYDDRGNVLLRRDPLGQVTRFTYDEHDNLLTETDPLGGVRSYTYDSRGSVVADTDRLGQTTTYTYNALGQELARVDPRGGVTAKTYDSRGNQLTDTDPAGGVTRYRYDAGGQIVETTDPAGATRTFTYDALGRQLSATDPLGHVTRRAYDGNGRVATETALTGGAARTITRAYSWDARGQLTEVVDPEGGVTATTYAPSGLRTSTTDQLGRQTRFLYDEQGRQTGIDHPDGSAERFEYDAEGRRTAAVDRSGRRVEYSYDAVGRVIATRAPDGASRTSTYDAAGRLIAQTDENGRTITNTYDAAGRPLSTTNALAETAQAAYDANGNVIVQRDASGSTTLFTYDLASRLIRTTFADGSSVSQAFDDAGRVLARTDQRGQQTHYEYNLRGELVAVVDALGHRTIYEYDDAGSRIAVTDATGRSTRYAYDLAGRLLTTTLPMGQRMTRSYDAVGNVISTVDYNGDLTLFAYDALDQLVLRTMPAGEVHQFRHALNGSLTALTDSRGTMTVHYDERHRPVVVRQPDGLEIRYAYDSVGNRTAVTTPAGTTRFAYDAANRVSTVDDAAGNRVAFTYNAVGKPTHVEYPGGLSSDFSYDNLNRLTQVLHHRHGTPVASYAYSLGLGGERLQVREGSGRQVDFSYDALGRLVRESVAGGGPAATTEYSYDAVGNRVMRVGSAGVLAYSYDGNHRLTTAGPATFAHDANGNLTARTVAGARTAYSYDVRGHLRQVTTPAGAVTRYSYDALGQRVQRVSPTATTNFLVDPADPSGLSQVLLESDGNGQTTTAYVQVGLVPLSQLHGGQTSFRLTDGQSSTRLLVDSSGSVTDTFTYDAFGNLDSRTGTTPSAFTFNGQEFDAASGFYNLRARQYDPLTGRFTSTDPFPGTEDLPVTLHPYLYARNDPVNFSDPSGETTLTEVMFVANAVLTLATTAYDLYQGNYKAAAVNVAITVVPFGSLFKSAFRGIKLLASSAPKLLTPASTVSSLAPGAVTEIAHLSASAVTETAIGADNIRTAVSMLPEAIPIVERAILAVRGQKELVDLILSNNDDLRRMYQAARRMWEIGYRNSDDYVRFLEQSVGQPGWTAKLCALKAADFVFNGAESSFGGVLSFAIARVLRVHGKTRCGFFGSGGPELP